MLLSDTSKERWQNPSTLVVFLKCDLPGMVKCNCDGNPIVRKPGKPATVMNTSPAVETKRSAPQPSAERPRDQTRFVSASQ